MTVVDSPPALADEMSGWAPPPAVTDDVAERAPDARRRWERPALAALLVGTAGLYLWGLSANGWANAYYSAAAQAGSQSWKAWFFGSTDAASSITVDKPPASLWVMGLSVRIFGLSSWSILVPQALMGVGTVAVVWRTVRRWFTPRAALLAGLVMAATPVAALMFRFNNPDALLVLLMVLAAHTTMRGIEDGRRRWIVLAGVAIGFAFLTKQLQALIVVPPLGLAYLVAAAGSIRRRIVDLLAGTAAVVVAAGWWIAIAELVPASVRPYIGGSQDNSVLELTFGYNGLGRLTGNETGSVGGGFGGGMWGETGLTRMVDGVIGGQIAWLLPAALVAIVVGLVVTRRAGRTDLTRAAVIVWGGWLVVTALVFSYMQGIFHEYYTVALAPAIAVMVGIGAELLWTRRHLLAARLVLAGTVAGSVWWAHTLLGRSPDFAPWLRLVVLAAGLAGAVALVAGPAFGEARRPLGRVLAGAGVGLAVAATLAGPTAYALDTAATARTGAIVTAGPAVTSGGFGPGAGGFPQNLQNGFPQNLPNLPGGFPTDGQVPTGVPGDGGGGFPGIGGGATGGLLDSAEPSQELVDTVIADADEYTWVAAAVGSNRAAGFQLASEEPVMAIGGFNGSDPSPTLEQFQQYVAGGEIHWFIDGGGFGASMGGSDEAASISEWVTSTFPAVTVDGVTLYDLSAGAG